MTVACEDEGAREVDGRSVEDAAMFWENHPERRLEMSVRARAVVGDADTADGS